MRAPYWDWTFRDGEVHYHQYCGTPPEHLLFALRAALDMIFAEGLEATFHRHRLLAEATRRAVGTWAEGQAFAFNISEPEERCDTVTAIVTPNGVNAPMIFGTLSVVEMALAALGIPHGRGGVQAAVEYLAKSVPAQAA